MLHKFQTASGQQGLSMIEILVVLVIMAIGLLGVAGLQLTSVRQTANAGFQTQAMFLAEDMIERIRANRDAVVQGTNQQVNLTPYTKKDGDAFPTSAEATCSTTGCTPAKMAQTDLYNWSQTLKSTLPITDTLLTSQVYICLDSNPADATACDGLGSTAIVRIAWQESALSVNASNKLEEGTLQAFQMGFEP